MSWSREQCEILVDEYEKHECLYAVKSPLYKNRNARLAALEAIQKELRKVKPNVTINDIKSKINGLRTNFLTEYRKWKSSKRTGTSEEAMYKPTIWYFEKMLFILDHVAVREGIDSIIYEPREEDTNFSAIEYEEEEEYVVTDQEAFEENSTSSDIIKPRTENKRKNQTNNVEDHFLEEASSALVSLTKNFNSTLTKKEKSAKEIENECFANFIITKLNQIDDEEVRLEVEEEITMKLFEAIRTSKRMKMAR